MEEKAELADRDKYQRLVGNLTYLSHTCPDITCSWGGKLVHAPTIGSSHGCNLKNCQVYTYADWAGDKGNRRSTPRYFSLVGGNLVTWKSKKQKVVSLSSAEVEFRGIS
uniref:uncharacterized mitochondrial protein AtMg00810-like n=1 Tax=Erigeron canadensis TaxID=72917 RepID=UPI001CB9391A|nr:uncharacterized mitochondrial protein AtMg00810-like [Erigeron canadensis]